jgi:flagellar hook assembly protein FlgD
VLRAPSKSIDISFTAGADAPVAVRLTIIDRQGRTVKKLIDDTFSAGPHSVPWDGTNDRDEKVASGSYQLQMTVGKRVFKQTLVVVR